MGSATHNPAFWYLRTLPGICGGFAAAYGTDELVTAFDRMSIQRPATCGSAAVRPGPGRIVPSHHLPVHLAPDPLRHSAAPFLKRPCDRALGRPRAWPHSESERHTESLSRYGMRS